MLSTNELQQLYRYALALCANSDDAYDLLQDSVERLLCREPPIAAKERMFFLRKVLRNRFIDTMRKAAIRNEIDIETDNTIALDTQPLEQIMYTEQALDHVWPLLNSDERELLFLWGVEGFTAQEIAQQLDSPRGTILSRLHRLKRRLQTQLNALGIKGGQS